MYSTFYYSVLNTEAVSITFVPIINLGMYLYHTGTNMYYYLFYRQYLSIYLSRYRKLFFYQYCCPRGKPLNYMYNINYLNKTIR